MPTLTKPVTITIVEPSGDIRTESTPGYVYGNVAVTRHYNGEGWTITHLTSGLTLGGVCGHACADMRNVARQLADINLPATNDGWESESQKAEAVRRVHAAWYSVYRRTCQRCACAPGAARVAAGHTQAVVCEACRTSADSYVTPTDGGAVWLDLERKSRD